MNILQKVGKTPLVTILEDENLHIHAKLESCNPTGSVKDRAAEYIIEKCLENKTISGNTTLIESSSGNFGISLAAFCKKHNLRFICVIDPHISPINEMLLKNLGAEVIKVSEPDDNGGYLLSRLKKVNELCESYYDCYWVNQYENPLAAEAYHNSLGSEIIKQISFEPDYLFCGVSSGGTITGLSQKMKCLFPSIKVVAVDIVGSVIFGNPPAKRFIPGIGSSIVPKILKNALIDEVMVVDELQTIDACLYLLRNHALFMGGSSGSVFAGIKQYFEMKSISESTNILTVFPDRGERYYHTVYNDQWRNQFETIISKEQKSILNNES